MRKTSQDGGDSTSITSGIENEVKKSNVGIIKTKRNSIKRKVQNFSHESDDTVIEPLLQIEKKETINRSAKYLLSKSKTESLSENQNNMYSDTKCEKSTVCKSISAAGTVASNSSISRTLHNHMNTNVFGAQTAPTVKSSVLVEISRPAIHSNLTSSIFTTAKIHADSVTKHMEPIQVTPVPILSTVEGNVVKASVSPEYGQNKTIASNMNTDVIKSSGQQGPKVQMQNTHQYTCTSHSAQVDDGKSDLFRPSTGDIVNKLGTIDFRTISITPITKTEIDTKLAHKSFDITMAKATASSNIKSSEIEKIPKISPATQTLANQLLDKKPVQEEQSNESLKETPNIEPKESQIKTAIKAVAGECLQKQNISSMKVTAPNVHDGTKTADKIISSNSNSSKQLQRQKKTIVEDPRDPDVHPKKTDMESVKADNESIKCSRDKTSTPNTTAIAQSFLHTVTPTNKSKIQFTQSTGSQNSNKEIGKITTTSLSQVTKSLTAASPHTAVTTNEIASLSITQATSMTALLASGASLEKKRAASLSQSTIPNEATPKSTVTLPAQSTVSVRPVATFEKKLGVSTAQSSKSIISDSLRSTATTKEKTFKHTVQVQPTQPISSLRLESEKKSTPSTNQSNKSVKEKSSKDPASKSIINNVTQNQKSVPALKVSLSSSIPVTSVADVRTSIVTEPHKSLKPQTTSTVATTNIMPSGTISVTKSEVIFKSTVVVPSNTKLPVAVSKNEPTKIPSIKSTSTTILNTTSPTTAKSTTVAKPSTSTSKPNLNEKHGKK